MTHRNINENRPAARRYVHGDPGRRLPMALASRDIGEHELPRLRLNNLDPLLIRAAGV